MDRSEGTVVERGWSGPGKHDRWCEPSGARLSNTVVALCCCCYCSISGAFDTGLHRLHGGGNEVCVALRGSYLGRHGGVIGGGERTGGRRGCVITRHYFVPTLMTSLEARVGGRATKAPVSLVAFPPQLLSWRRSSQVSVVEDAIEQMGRDATRALADQKP